MDLQVKIERVLSEEEKIFLLNCNREIQSLNITSDSEFTNASAVLKTLRDEQKDLRALRLSITKPLNDEVERVMEEWFKPYMDKYDKTVNLLSNGMVSYENRKREAARLEQQRREEEERREAARRLEEINAKERIDEAETTEMPKSVELPIVTQDEIKQDFGLKEIPLTEAKTARVVGLKTVVNWDVVIVDEHLIPRSYFTFTLDISKLRQMAKVLQDKFNVPGVKLVFIRIQRFNE